jgi:hypothetical protein
LTLGLAAHYPTRGVGEGGSVVECTVIAAMGMS